MLDLTNVSIVSINGRDPENSVKAIKYSCKNIKFNSRILITNQKLHFKDIETIFIPDLNNLEQYNFFCVKELFKYIKTDYCLIVQPDGFVINPSGWSKTFLEYDYIGAPWPPFLASEVLGKCGMTAPYDNLTFVGNGGFSLRSKKFLNATSLLNYDNPSLEEDCFVAALKRKELKNNFNIKYAPVSVGQYFSLEHIINEDSFHIFPFGFHGKMDYLSGYLNLIKEIKL